MRQLRMSKILVFIIALVLVQLACGSSNGNDPTAPPVNTQPPPVNDPPPPVITDPPPPVATDPPASGQAIDYASLQSGDLVYFTDFDGPGDWEDGWLQLPIPTGNDNYKVYLDGYSNMFFDITQSNTDVIAWLDTDILYFPRDLADVYVEASVFNVGKNTVNNISVMCRFSDEGFYMFSLMSGGKWYIWKFTAEKGFKKLIEGGLQDFDYYSPHVIAGSCIGDELTLYVDNVMPKNAQFTERTFREGGVGIGVYSNRGNVEVEFDEFAVSIP